ncbi:MAG: hypothetical protein HYV68_03750 [Candidatus Taylorbacteria bacterium]|nr:hypothetical protein [Candidatus Taylorbacteria bacterium]
MKQMLKSKLKGLPDGEADKIITMVEKNPALFMQIAQEIEAKLKEGGDQMQVTMEVMKAHEAELKGLIGNK